MRHPLERFGLGITACGLLMATLIAWLLTQVAWGTQRVYDGTVNWIAYSHERHLYAEGAVHVGIAGVVLGIFMILLGKALGRADRIV